MEAMDTLSELEAVRDRLTKLCADIEYRRTIRIKGVQRELVILISNLGSIQEDIEAEDGDNE